MAHGSLFLHLRRKISLVCRWIFKIKLKVDGSLERYKAYLVENGYHQWTGVDFMDTFSPVVKTTTVHLLLSLPVTNGWHITQLYISNAFLHGHLDEVVYMHQPPAIDPSHPDHFCLLKRSLYGLKQAPQMWNKHLIDALLSLGFMGSKTNSSLFYMSTPGDKHFC